MILITSLIIGILALTIAIGYKCYNPKATDSDLVEQVCEKIVKEETGVDVSVGKEEQNG